MAAFQKDLVWLICSTMVRGDWRLAAGGSWRLAVGGWRLAVCGGWWLAVCFALCTSADLRAPVPAEWAAVQWQCKGTREQHIKTDARRWPAEDHRLNRRSDCISSRVSRGIKLRTFEVTNTAFICSLMPRSTTPCPWGRDASEGKGPLRRPQKRLDMRLEEVAKAVGGRLSLVTHATEAGSRRQGHSGWASWRGGGYPPPLCGLQRFRAVTEDHPPPPPRAMSV